MTLAIKEVTGLLGGLSELVDDLFTTDEEREAAKLKVLQLFSAERLGQMQVNANEASSSSMFVAGWRPAAGWVCVAALGWQYILLPIFVTGITSIALANGVPIDLTGLLQFDMVALMPVLLGMLGLSVSRSYEKTKGVNRNTMGDPNGL